MQLPSESSISATLPNAPTCVGGYSTRGLPGPMDGQAQVLQWQADHTQAKSACRRFAHHVLCRRAWLVGLA